MELEARSPSSTRQRQRRTEPERSEKREKGQDNDKSLFWGGVFETVYTTLQEDGGKDQEEPLELSLWGFGAAWFAEEYFLDHPSAFRQHAGHAHVIIYFRSTAKFKALGYQDPELNGLDDYQMLAQFHLPLTEHAWEDMRGKLEGSIKDKRRDRFKDIPTIRDICEREPGVEVTGADFADVSGIIANWVADKRARLTELANNNTASGTTGGSNFNLASTIFRCKIKHEKLGRPAMFGGNEAMRHVGQPCAPELDVPLSALVSELVVLLGLDPNITTVADMDRHTARFRCDGRARYSECAKVTHAIENHEYGKRESWFSGSDDDGYYKNGTVNYVAVPEDVAARAVGPSNNDVPKAESSSWVCGHCTEYVGRPETLQGVTAHVRTVHGKPTPDGLDILLAPGVLPISRSYSIRGPGAAVATVARPRRTNNNNNGAFRCLRCEKSSRTFAGVRPVSDHLKGKHKIVNAVCDVDYEHQHEALWWQRKWQERTPWVPIDVKPARHGRWVKIFGPLNTTFKIMLPLPSPGIRHLRLTGVRPPDRLPIPSSRISGYRPPNRSRHLVPGRCSTRPTAHRRAPHSGPRGGALHSLRARGCYAGARDGYYPLMDTANYLAVGGHFPLLKNKGARAKDPAKKRTESRGLEACKMFCGSSVFVIDMPKVQGSQPIDKVLAFLRITQQKAQANVPTSEKIIFQVVRCNMVLHKWSERAQVQ
ncbi:hypothetical protein K438DRAFT_1746740 [Mycena galopus ATCC 62051]|nr:hypothetical protein K438DRAFT_1746740 [Mycena galopus ATCC 62051]